MTAASGVADRLRTAKLAVRVDADRDDLPALAGELFAGGVNLLHLDRAGPGPSPELTVLRAVRATATAHQGLISTGPAALTDGFSADVVQLAPGDDTASEVRRRLHRWAQVGRSITAVAELGPLLADPDVHHLWVEGDLALVRAVAAQLPPQGSSGKPWFAPGGTDQQSLEDVLVAGARRVLVGSGLTTAADPRAAAQRIRARLNQAWRDDPAMAAAGFVLRGSPRPFRRG